MSRKRRRNYEQQSISSNVGLHAPNLSTFGFHHGRAPVIAIIMIIFAMLLPALSRAKEAARGILCISNQRQNYAYCGMYASDWSNTMPTGPAGRGNTPIGLPNIEGVGFGENSWHAQVSIQANLRGATAAESLAKISIHSTFFCPTAVKEYLSFA